MWRKDTAYSMGFHCGTVQISRNSCDMLVYVRLMPALIPCGGSFVNLMEACANQHKWRLNVRGHRSRNAECEFRITSQLDVSALQQIAIELDHECISQPVFCECWSKQHEW